jgi:phenylalanyl-tRNA synthetase beta chain
MLRAIERNEKAGTIDGRLFEIASRFEADALPLTDYPREKETLCAGIWGSKESFFTMKGIADTVAAFLRVSFTYENAQKPFLHPYQCAMIYCGEECVGYLGTVRYELMKTFNLRTKAYLLELDLSRLEKYYGNAVKFTPIPKFPVEKRDLALVMAKEITCAQVEEVIRGACRQVSDVALFDVYEGNPIPQGKRSMAFTVTFTPDEEELTAERIDSFVHKILKMLRKTLDIDLRE